MSGRDEAYQGFLPEWLFVAFLLGAVLSLILMGTQSPGDVKGAPAVFITELAATHQADVLNEEGKRSDWIELGNFSSNAVNLAGWYLTDNFHKLTKWQFPPIELKPGKRLVVFASGKDRRDPSRPLHTNFKLNDRGEYLALVRSDGKTVAHEFMPKYPRQRGAFTYGLREDLQPGGRAVIPPDAYRYFAIPTPGANNRDEMLGLVADLKVSAPGTLLNGPMTVALFTRTPGARIYCTTNGDTPDEVTGQLYHYPLSIRGTTVLRAAAFQSGFAPTEIVTRSYIFPTEVLHQTGAGFPTSWGLTNGQPVAAYYRMDPRITETPRDRDDLLDGLRSIPTLSIVTETPNLFDTQSGIYANPLARGSHWERPASVELIYPDGQPGFQIDCGLRIQGGWNRRPEECPKHSIRLLFKKQYGPSHLHFPLFGKTGVTDFDTLILRGGCNNTWLHWSGEERHRGDYVRDQWMRDTALAMGHPAARGIFVHLYLNGLYWGLYNLVERPSAPFVAASEGGKPDDYDSRKADKILIGDAVVWDQLFALANAGISNPAAFQAINSLLDVPEFIDYMILNYYGANADWDRASNWYAARRRNPPGKFQFFVWDGERTLENVTDNTIDFDDDQSPARLFHKLEANIEFRRLVAAHVERLCGNDGVLSPQSAAARFRKRADEIESAILAESARWGSYRHEVHPYKTGPYEVYTRDEHWRPEIQRVLHQYFPLRTEEFLKQMRERRLYPPENVSTRPKMARTKP